jgi:hypothetical protein
MAHADAGVPAEVSIAQAQQNARDVAERQGRRMAEIQAWSQAEAMAQRLAAHTADSAVSMARGIEMSQKLREQLGLPLEDPPLPDPLPPEFIGQSESFIRAAMRNGWKPQKIDVGPDFAALTAPQREYLEAKPALPMHVTLKPIEKPEPPKSDPKWTLAGMFAGLFKDKKDRPKP